MPTRRAFMSVSTLAMATVTTSSLSSFVVARDPVPDRKAPKFKLSLAAYSYRDQLAPKKGKPMMDLHGFIEECAAMQLDGAELTGYYMPAEPDEAYLRDLRSHCFRAGLSVSGTATRNEFGWPPSHENHKKEIDHVKKWIDYAYQLHAPTLRIFAGHPQLKNDEASTHAWMVQSMKEAARYAGEKGVYLGLENHGGPTETADGLLKLIHDVDSPWLGANLDTGNFRGEEDPYTQMEKVAPYAVNAQVKVVLPTKAGKVPMDYKRVASILRKANYRGYVVLEYEEPGDVAAECRKAIAELRSALQ